MRFVALLTAELDGLRAVLSFVARWLLAAAVLGAAIALVVYHGSATRQTLPWVSVGTGLVMAAWTGMSILFGIYVPYVANHGSAFGTWPRSSCVLLHVYASSMAFLVGAPTDACIRRTSSAESGQCARCRTVRGSRRTRTHE